MKRTIKELLFVALAIITFVGMAEVSQAVITGSAHDFSNLPNAKGQICLPCHAPHNADTTVANAPLWNHEQSTATYTLYSSPTLDAVPGQPAGVSKLCLSCHDGTVAIDAFGGQPGSIFFPPTSDNNMGTDLSNDHPISFIYDTALAQVDGGLFDPTITPSGITGTAGGSIDDEMLFAGSLECSSCHDVHNTYNNDELLLKPNGGSALCLTCHNT